MRKETAIAIFGSGAALGRAIELTRGAIHNWPDELDQRKSDLVIGAALRLNKISFEEASRLAKQECSITKEVKNERVGIFKRDSI